MPNIFKFFSSSEAKDYVFQEMNAPKFEADESEAAEEEETDAASQEADNTPTAIDYAHIQADAIMDDARRQAEEFLEQARESMQAEAERVYQEARESGYQKGYAEGMEQAREEGARKQAEEAERLAGEVQQFLRQAGKALDRQLEDNLDDLRDLAIAIAEKVISVSLKSSTDIIGRMVQTALDKRKHREWVYIYIAERDIKHKEQIPASLMSAVSGLSDRVRIIPMADDESGACVIEMPEEIIDASVSTQLSNIRSMLTDVRPDAGDNLQIHF